MIKTSQRIIARNWRGKIVKARGIVNQRKGEAIKEETLAARNAVMMAKNAGWTKIKVHTDCKSVVNKINSCNDYDYNIATILEDI